MEQKEGIRYIERILKEVSDETKYTESEVIEAWEIHKKYMKSLMDNPNIIRIDLPFLGVFYFSMYKAIAILKRSGSQKHPKISNKIKKTEEIIKKHKQMVVDSGYITKFIYPQKRKGGLYKLLNNIRIMLGEKSRTSYASKERLFRTIENYSNGRLNK